MSAQTSLFSDTVYEVETSLLFLAFFFFITVVTIQHSLFIYWLFSPTRVQVPQRQGIFLFTALSPESKTMLRTGYAVE